MSVLYVSVLYLSVISEFEIVILRMRVKHVSILYLKGVKL